MSYLKSIQNVNRHEQKWDQAIRDAQKLLGRAEDRAARLKGAIGTFTELRDHVQDFDPKLTTATQ